MSLQEHLEVNSNLQQYLGKYLAKNTSREFWEKIALELCVRQEYNVDTFWINDIKREATPEARSIRFLEKTGKFPLDYILVCCDRAGLPELRKILVNPGLINMNCPLMGLF